MCRQQQQQTGKHTCRFIILSLACSLMGKRIVPKNSFSTTFFSFCVSFSLLFVQDKLIALVCVSLQALRNQENHGKRKQSFPAFSTSRFGTRFTLAACNYQAPPSTTHYKTSITRWNKESRLYHHHPNNRLQYYCVCSLRAGLCRISQPLFLVDFSITGACKVGHEEGKFKSRIDE